VDADVGHGDEFLPLFAFPGLFFPESALVGQSFFLEDKLVGLIDSVLSLHISILPADMMKILPFGLMNSL